MGTECRSRGRMCRPQGSSGSIRRKAFGQERDAMPVAQKAVVRIAPNNPVFDLPVIVGIEEGLFADAGLDVHFTATYADREKDKAGLPVMSRLKEHLFDSGSAD